MAFWITWFISEATTVLFSTIITTVMLYTCQHFIHTGFGWIFLGFLLFGLAYCCFGIYTYWL